MNRLWRQVRALVNPVSTAATRWWCHSAMRHRLTGYGPTAGQRRSLKRATPAIRPGAPAAGFIPAAEQTKARAEAIGNLLSRDEH
jgi:hypothetical protein